MRKSVLSLIGAAGLAVFTGPSAQAQSITCGESYTIQRGDTLQQLTNRTYGPGKSYFTIYNANKGVIGANPSLVEIGMVLTIPCAHGATPTSTAATPAATPTPTTAAPVPVTNVLAPATQSILPSTTQRLLRIVTATDYAPYIDQDQEQGGMLVEIVNSALTRVTSKDSYKIDWVNDWSAHLQPLIEDGAYDLSLAWFRPPCEVREKLGEASQFRCDSLAWSDPLFEQIIGYYMRTSEAAFPTKHSDLFGRTVCRPKGYSQFMMEEKDIVEPNVKIVTPDGPGGCFEMLLEGTADAVVIATTVADNTLATMDMASQVVEVPELATVSTLNAVTSINNPQKDAQLALLNDGLRKIREDGSWFEIVQRHLIAHARMTAKTN